MIRMKFVTSLIECQTIWLAYIETLDFYLILFKKIL